MTRYPSVIRGQLVCWEQPGSVLEGFPNMVLVLLFPMIQSSPCIARASLLVARIRSHCDPGQHPRVNWTGSLLRVRALWVSGGFSSFVGLDVHELQLSFWLAGSMVGECQTRDDLCGGGLGRLVLIIPSL